MTHRHTLRILTLVAAMATLVACTDDDSSLGVSLIDPATLYNGHCDTLRADTAYSLRDDSILTSGYTYAAIGNYSDAQYGKVSAEWYTQIALQTSRRSINFDTVTIDSAILTLVNHRLFPNADSTYDLHFVINQLASPLNADSNYYAYSRVPINESQCFYDSTISCSPTDTVIHLLLRPNIHSVLAQSANAEEFNEITKGLRVRLDGDAGNAILAINLAAVKTCLTVYYRYGTDTTTSTYVFNINDEVKHFSSFSHDYSGSLAGGSSNIDGASTLLLEPMGGYNAVISFDRAVRSFAAQHPRAVIHHAELLLPLNNTSDTNVPEQIIALQRRPGSNDTYIHDLTDIYTFNGYDGRCAKGRYRLRVTQHLQGLLRNGCDNGTMLTINSRRYDARRTVLNGYASSNAPQIVFVYSE